MNNGELAVRELLRIADDVLDLANGIGGGEGELAIPVRELNTSEMTLIEFDEPMIGRLATEEYQFRRKRTAHLNADLFGEPAWDMLLDLVVHRVRQKRVSVTSLCIASAVPPTTALRWIKFLQERGLVKREESNTDKRVAFVRLTDEGWLGMGNYFREKMGRKNASLKLSASG